MLFNKKSVEKSTPAPPITQPTPETNSKPMNNYERPATSNAVNTICADTVIEGEIKTSSNMRIDGTVVGTINSTAKVVLSNTGKLEGDLFCENAEIAGEMDGKVQSNDLLILKESAKINGDVITDKIVIEPGAQIVGVCNMAVKPQAAKSTVASTKKEKEVVVTSNGNGAKVESQLSALANN